ncbi:hypothetical protein C1645_871869 [Glomus cerebriforme]|uniref:Uncharacterized protein n=1 Tax=Glomus cerebriforme TaxID=658196 RepID=A0A397TEX8_9GLOM|nr:hypothetical protein C1645_871869 [Glomus cerebriforme]
MQSLCALCDELKIEIFKFIEIPISLALTNRKWYTISQDSQARAKWLLHKYGKAHALFHAVRLGNNFITIDTVQALFAGNAIISRYFVQRLLMHFGLYDERLIELRIEHLQNVNHDRTRDFRGRSWASDLPYLVFEKLINEGYKRLNDKNLPIRGNDMELFHFLSAGPLVIEHAPLRLLQNLDKIKDLILNQKFIPFPPRKKLIYEDTVEYIQLTQTRAHENYPPRDGHENSRQLNVIARAILIHPNLVNMWKKIGYHEICDNLNELVMQGALLILFPPTPPTNWVCPDFKIVSKRLEQLILLGFQLSDTVMEVAFNLFEHRLLKFGDILMKSFEMIHKESKSAIACSCLIQTIKSERNHNKFDLLEFLIGWIDKPEEALYNALEYYNVGFKFDVNSIKTTEKIRSLSVQSNVYYWILKKFGPNSKVTQKCFDDIIESRIWIDLKLQETPEREIPEHLTSLAFNSICSIYLEFCNERIPFKTDYLSYLQLANNEEIIRPLFKTSLPIVFGLQLINELPYEINYEYNRPEINDIQNNNKRKFNEMIDQPDWNKRGEWIKSLEQIPLNNSDVVSENFINIFKEFWESIKSSQISEIDDEINSKRVKKKKF